MADNAASKRPSDAIDLSAEASPQEKKMRASINDVAADLLCPITQELPFDPVMAKDGKIYERRPSWSGLEIKMVRRPARARVR